jgi:stage II sporulation protein R
MKNACIIFSLSIIIILVALFGAGGFGAVGQWGVNVQTTGAGTEFLRIHVRANSNAEDDQRVKYLVRDELVEYLTPVVATCESKSEATKAIQACEDELSRLATKVLKEHGFDYLGKAVLRQEKFPTRVYDDVILPAGEYDSLIVELGEAKGDNWWCVVYPPLCFSGGKVTAGNVIYKSKIAEIIADWKETR